MNTSSRFYYDKVYSRDKGVTKIRTSSGLIIDTFLATITNQISKPKNNLKSFISDSESEPLVIPMALYFDENLDDSSIRSVKKWLNQKDFKELVFEDQPERVFYAKIDGDINLSHNAISSGFIEFNFLTNSAYSFSRLIEMEGESTSSTEYHSLLIYNEGDLVVSPKITLNMDTEEATEIELYNDTTSEHFLLRNNVVNETVVVLNEYEEFETSSSLRHCYDDHNGQFISFAEGVNELRLKGKFNYKIEYQAIYL